MGRKKRMSRGRAPVKQARYVSDPQDDEEKCLLLLKPFTTIPRMSFNDVRIGQLKTKTLTLYNPLQAPQTVTVEKFPSEKGFDIDQKELNILPHCKVDIHISWRPKKAIMCHETVFFKSSAFSRAQVNLHATTLVPKEQELEGLKKKLAEAESDNMRLKLRMAQLQNDKNEGEGSAINTTTFAKHCKRNRNSSDAELLDCDSTVVNSTCGSLTVPTSTPKELLIWPLNEKSSFSTSHLLKENRNENDASNSTDQGLSMITAQRHHDGRFKIDFNVSMPVSIVLNPITYNVSCFFGRNDAASENDSSSVRSLSSITNSFTIAPNRHSIRETENPACKKRKSRDLVKCSCNQSSSKECEAFSSRSRNVSDISPLKQNSCFSVDTSSPFTVLTEEQDVYHSANVQEIENNINSISKNDCKLNEGSKEILPHGNKSVENVQSNQVSLSNSLIAVAETCEKSKSGRPLKVKKRSRSFSQVHDVHGNESGDINSYSDFKLKKYGMNLRDRDEILNRKDHNELSAYEMLLMEESEPQGKLFPRSHMQCANLVHCDKDEELPKKKKFCSKSSLMTEKVRKKRRILPKSRKNNKLPSHFNQEKECGENKHLFEDRPQLRNCSVVLERLDFSSFGIPDDLSHAPPKKKNKKRRGNFSKLIDFGDEDLDFLNNDEANGLTIEDTICYSSETEERERSESVSDKNNSLEKVLDNISSNFDNKCNSNINDGVKREITDTEAENIGDNLNEVFDVKNSKIDSHGEIIYDEVVIVNENCLLGAKYVNENFSENILKECPGVSDEVASDCMVVQKDNPEGASDCERTNDDLDKSEKTNVVQMHGQILKEKNAKLTTKFELKSWLRKALIQLTAQNSFLLEDGEEFSRRLCNKFAKRGLLTLNILHAIFYRLCACEKNVLTLFETHASPLLTREEKGLSMTIVELEKVTDFDYSRITDLSLEMIQLLVLSKKNVSSLGLASLCRMAGSISRKKGDKFKAVTLCCEILKRKLKYAAFFIANIIATWKTLFSVPDESSSEDDLMFRCAISYGTSCCLKSLETEASDLYESTCKVISPYFVAPALDSVQLVLDLFMRTIETLCAEGSFEKLSLMKSGLVIVASHFDLDWVKENILQNFIRKNLEKYSSQKASAAAFDMYCDLYVDVLVIFPEKCNGKAVLLNYFKCKTLEEDFAYVKDCAAKYLVKFFFNLNEDLPPLLSDWFNANRKNTKMVNFFEYQLRMRAMSNSPDEILIEDFFVA